MVFRLFLRFGLLVVDPRSAGMLFYSRNVRVATAAVVAIAAVLSFSMPDVLLRLVSVLKLLDYLSISLTTFGVTQFVFI